VNVERRGLKVSAMLQTRSQIFILTQGVRRLYCALRSDASSETASADWVNLTGERLSYQWWWTHEGKFE